MASTVQPLPEHIRNAVAARYSAIGRDPLNESVIPAGRAWAERLGYPQRLLDTMPARAVAAFTGIGAPVLEAGLKAGERVLDLGCGAGLDSIVMAYQVASNGQVYGVDLAPGMLASARETLAETGLRHVTLLQAVAEDTPLPDASIDVAVVNGLFNLVPDKKVVADEVARVLRPGGRIVGAEIIITDQRTPQEFDPESWFR